MSKLIMHLFISCIFGLLLHKCLCFELWTAFEVEYVYSTTLWVEYLYFNTPFKTPISVLITVYRGEGRGGGTVSQSGGRGGELLKRF